ncbi:helix-turn-helix transcriptional regulator [Streptomyces sp. Tu 2975]|uniref:transcriptional regulator n=1 Tax=Streptomyces sp. Tu 2975 TaxID=2676871 RepID=UPI001FC91119|nr:helix-turn-helix transcriptional regulator [Streptomyces sp. Tu 2975]
MATTPETEQLATVLRQLKDRSGLSYGVLATKLHVSTSTLHRYCNGDAVPAEFASVDRLARLCGAQREELVDLHRRWIVADEARRRGRAGAEPATSAAAPVTPVTPVTPVAADEEAGAGTDVTGGGAKAGVTAEAAGSPAISAPAADEPAPPPATGHTDEGGPRPRALGGTRRKALLVAVAAAAVVALAVPVAVVASNAGDSGDSGDTGTTADGPAGSVEAPQTAASRSASASVSGSPSTSASPSGSPDTSASRAGATPSAEASRDGKAPAGAGGVPLRVGVSSYNWASPCGQHYLLDGKSGSVPPPPAPQDYRNWARALGGVDAGRMQLQLTATGRTEDSVVINAVHVRTVARNAALAWNAYSMGEGCGSGVTPQTFDVDLDAGRPVVKPVAGTDGDLTVPAKDFPYKVASNDPQVLNFDVHTEGHDVSWYLEVVWSSGDRSGTVRIDDGGRPFRTSAAEGRPMHDYWPDKGEWVAR